MRLQSSSNLLLHLVAALLVVAGVYVAKRPAGLDTKEPELAEYMAQLQYYSHKLMLATAAENQPLARFYLHEVEELTEAIVEDVPSYEGYPIGSLVETMLVPSVKTLDAHLDEATWNQVPEALGAYVQACNGCHAATDHGFIEITIRTDENPYNQEFD